MRLIIQRFLLAVALVAAAVMFIPSPAQAGGQYIKICFPVGSLGGTVIWDCYWIEVPVLGPGPWPPGCPQCVPEFDFWKDLIDPAVEEKFNDYLGAGFATLAASALTDDVKLAKQLRAQATQLLITAAEIIEKYPIELNQVGWVDLKSGKVYKDPEPQPALEGIGKDLTAGISLLQAALDDPEPQPNIEAALKQFDEAYAGLAALAKT